MKLKPEERKAAAKDLLAVLDRAVDDLVAVLIKHGLSPDTVASDLKELDELRGMLRRELES